MEEEGKGQMPLHKGGDRDSQGEAQCLVSMVTLGGGSPPWLWYLFTTFLYVAVNCRYYHGSGALSSGLVACTVLSAFIMATTVDPVTSEETEAGKVTQAGKRERWDMKLRPL